MKYAFVEFIGSKGERLAMRVRDYERYKNDHFIKSEIFRFKPELVIYENIYIDCFSLVDFARNIKKYNPESFIKVTMPLTDIAFQRYGVSGVVKMFGNDIEL